MTSEAKIAANRRNALQSTGPRTEAGKAVASCNALRHGLTAEAMVLHDESAEAFAEFKDALRAAFAPEGEFEERLVERIVVCFWRLRRASRLEAELLTRMAESPHGNDRASTAFTLRPDAIATLMRHEASIDRSLSRALMVLERQQARRRGEPVSSPAALKINVALAPAASDAAQGA